MLIHHTQRDSKGVFYVGDGDSPIAELVYTKPAFDKMILEHTEVAEELKGQNIGYQLVEAAVEYARQHQFKILPLCPFANAVFKKKPEYQDVLMH